jgi:hypothetical protein
MPARLQFVADFCGEVAFVLDDQDGWAAVRAGSLFRHFISLFDGPNLPASAPSVRQRHSLAQGRPRDCKIAHIARYKHLSQLKSGPTR